MSHEQCFVSKLNFVRYSEFNIKVSQIDTPVLLILFLYGKKIVDVWGLSLKLDPHVRLFLGKISIFFSQCARHAAAA